MRLHDNIFRCEFSWNWIRSVCSRLIYSHSSWYDYKINMHSSVTWNLRGGVWKTLNFVMPSYIMLLVLRILAKNPSLDIRNGTFYDILEWFISLWLALWSLMNKKVLYVENRKPSLHLSSNCTIITVKFESLLHSNTTTAAYFFGYFKSCVIKNTEYNGFKYFCAKLSNRYKGCFTKK